MARVQAARPGVLRQQRRRPQLLRVPQLRRLAARQRHQPRPRLLRDLPLPTATRQVVQRRHRADRQRLVHAPLHLRTVRAQTPHDLRDLLPVRVPQQHPRPLHPPDRLRPRTRHRPQLPPRVVRQLQRPALLRNHAVPPWTREQTIPAIMPASQSYGKWHFGNEPLGDCTCTQSMQSLTGVQLTPPPAAPKPTLGRSAARNPPGRCCSALCRGPLPGLGRWPAGLPWGRRSRWCRRRRSSRRRRGSG